MLALMAVLFLASPLPPPAPKYPPGYYSDECAGQVLCPFAPDGTRYCICAPGVVVLDRFDYRPSEPATVALTKPEPFGAYPCELHEGSPAVQAAPVSEGPEMQLSPSWRDEMGFGQ